MGGAESEQLYQEFLRQMRAAYKPEAIKGTDVYFFSPLNATMVSLLTFSSSEHTLENDLKIIYLQKLISGKNVLFFFLL